MTRDGPRPALLLGLLAALVLTPSASRAQGTDCAALQAEIDAAGRSGGPGQYDTALRQQRAEIARSRAYADQSGCGDGFFDDPDSPQCRTLARRTHTLEIGLQRLQDQADRGDPAADDRRRALLEEFNAACTATPSETGVPGTTLPVDPDAPPAPAPASPPRSAAVLCVRQCDGAYYPLAVDVASDRMDDMDRVCQAQCPAATASAYAGTGTEDVANAVASDGTRYADLATAFQFRKGGARTCACRAPNQSWSEALAGAEALLQPHKGDVTVTPALSAAMMARPAAPPPGPAPAKASAPARKPARRPAEPALAPLPEAAPPPDPERDLTREFRRSVPTL